MSSTIYKIRLDSRQFESQFARVELKVSKLEKRLARIRLGGAAGAARGGAARGGFLGLSPGLLGVTALATGITLITKKIARLGVESEKAKLTLSGLFGGKVAGQAEFKATEQFAKFTPFNFQQVLKSRIGLGARGVSRENQLPLLEILGNFSSILGTETLPFLSKAVGDVISKGRLQGQEIRQFSESGVNIRQLVADLKGISVSQVEKTFISARDVIEALQRGSGKGTVFFNAMEKASKTVGGRFETTKDTLDEILRGVGEDLLPMMNTGLQALNSTLLDLQGKNLSEFFSSSINALQTLVSIPGVFLPGENKLLSVIDTWTIAMNGLATAADAVKTTLQIVALGNPLTSGAQAVALLGGLSEREGERKEKTRRILANFGVARDARGRPITGAEAATSAGTGALNLSQFSDATIGGKAAGAAGGAGGSRVSGVRGGVRTVNISVENLIREQNINGQTALGQTAEDIKIQVTRALQTVFAEARIAI